MHQPKGIYIGSCGADDGAEEDSDEDIPTGLAETDSGALDEDIGDANTAVEVDNFNGLNIQHKDLLNPPAKKSDTHYLSVTGEKHYIPTLIT